MRKTTAMGVTRVELFSDAVFAIAITLLVLDIRVPEDGGIHDAGELWNNLFHLWPSYLGFAFSFLVIGVMWINHHAVFEYLGHIDRLLMFVNLLLLMGIAFLPFSSAILAEHLADPDTRPLASAYYGVTLTYITVMFNLLWWLGRRQRKELHLEPHLVQGERTITIRYAVSLACVVAAAAFTLVNVWLSLSGYLLLVLWNGFSERLWRR
jgi:uncharacterized membrane protein